MTESGWGTPAKRWVPPSAADAPRLAELDQPKILKGPNGSIYCDVCTMWLNGDEQYRDHIAGHKHERNMRPVRALRAERAMLAITMLLVAKWKEEQRVLRHRVLLLALKVWAGPRWLRAVQASHAHGAGLGADGSSP